MQNCTLLWLIGSCKLALNPALQIAHIWLLQLGARIILVLGFGFSMGLLTATNGEGTWPAMASCYSEPVILVGSDGLLSGVTDGDVPLGPYVTTSSSMGSLIAWYLATSLLSRGFPYSGDGIVTSEFSCLSTQRVSDTCIILLKQFCHPHTTTIVHI